MTTSQRTLRESIESSLQGTAAFCYACGVFLSIATLFRFLPETAPVAVGLITILRYSKLSDYATAGLFFVLVPPLTLAFHRALGVLLSHEDRLAGSDRTVARVIFCASIALSPLFYLTTGKIGWVLVLPVAIAYGSVRLRDLWRRSLWLRARFAPAMAPYHALLMAASGSWLIFRYLVSGHRVAHVPTLLLETVFSAGLLALFWAASLLAARLAEIEFSRDPDDTLKRIATGAIVLVFLPIVAFVEIPTRSAAASTVVALLIAAWIAIGARPLRPERARALAAWILFPFAIYCISYGSSGGVSQWIDLFHRGESLGPASDYLRGKAPFREVFVLHGMLEDGLLDAWLMHFAGRSVAVTIARTAILGGLLSVSLWFLGLVVFDSLPLAAIVVAVGAWTTAENDRTFFQVAAVALFWTALKKRRRGAAIASGVFAAVAMFFSYDVGIYTVAGAVLATTALALCARRTTWEGMPPFRALLLFFFGFTIGAFPFVAYLMSRDALADFVRTAFVTIPRIIDAVWSLPFPDIVSGFRANNLNLHTLADFVLADKFHLILSPLVIGIAAIYFLSRLLLRRLETIDYALLVVALFALVTQRTAFGRAEFRHQYFAAFLIGPLLVILLLAAARALRARWNEGEFDTRALIAVVVAALLPAAALLFWIPDLVNGRIDDLTNYQRRVIRVIHEPRAEEVNDRIAAVSDHVTDLVPPGRPIFDFSNQPAFYFFADRPNPTRFYQIPIASPAAFQAEVIRDLERSRPGVVLRKSPEGYDEFDGVPNSLRAQAISAYLDDCYEFERAVRGVEIWTRRPNVQPAPLATYLTKIRMPQPEQLVSGPPERLVFPLVGTTEGVGGALWQSDLTLHNALRHPITVSLRFATADRHIDREVHLLPRQTILWPDVSHSLFGLDRSIGTLWIAYHTGAAPVAAVKTSDVAHGGRASITGPLARSDAASAGQDGELTIIGIPSFQSTSRRLSLGVVNTGIAPATYRVSVRTRSGARIGRSVTVDAAEDEVALLRAPETELGVAIDETMTVRISVLNGTGVAFAAYVDASGGTEMIPAVPSQPQ